MTSILICLATVASVSFWNMQKLKTHEVMQQPHVYYIVVRPLLCSEFLAIDWQLHKTVCQHCYWGVVSSNKGMESGFLLETIRCSPSNTTCPPSNMLHWKLYTTCIVNACILWLTDHGVVNGSMMHVVWQLWCDGVTWHDVVVVVLIWYATTHTMFCIWHAVYAHVM